MSPSDDDTGKDVSIPPAVPTTDQESSSPADSPPEMVSALKTGLVLTPLSGTIQSLQDAGVRGQSGMLLLQAFTGRLEADLDAARAEAKALRGQLDDARRQFYEERERGSVLREQIRTLERSRWFQAVSLALGGLVGGVAAPHLNDPHPGFAIAATSLGLVLLVLGCVPLRSRSGER